LLFPGISYATALLLSPYDGQTTSNQPRLTVTSTVIGYRGVMSIFVSTSPDLWGTSYNIPYSDPYYYLDFKERSISLTPGTYYWRGMDWTGVSQVRSFIVPVPSTISYSSQSYNFSGVQGSSNPANQILSISNSGGSNLFWKISSNVNWLNASPSFGYNGGQVSLWPNISNLPVGTYEGVLTITGEAFADYPATNSPVTILVKLTISAPAPSASASQAPKPKVKVKVVSAFHKKQCKNKKFHARHCKAASNKKQTAKNKRFHKKKCTKIIFK